MSDIIQEILTERGRQSIDFHDRDWNYHVNSFNFHYWAPMAFCRQADQIFYLPCWFEWA